MTRPHLNIISPLSKHDQATLRRTVVDLILATDMKQHLSIISRFVALHPPPPPEEQDLQLDAAARPGCTPISNRNSAFAARASTMATAAADAAGGDACADRPTHTNTLRSQGSNCAAIYQGRGASVYGVERSGTDKDGTDTCVALTTPSPAEAHAVARSPKSATLGSIPLLLFGKRGHSRISESMTALGSGRLDLEEGGGEAASLALEVRAASTPRAPPPPPRPLDDADKLLTLQMAIKCADTVRGHTQRAPVPSQAHMHIVAWQLWFAASRRLWLCTCTPSHP